MRWLFFEQDFFEASVGTARFWTMTGRGDPAAIRPRAEAALGVLAEGVGDGWLVGDVFTLADHVLYAYAHVAADAEIVVPPAVSSWCKRVEAQPGHTNDLMPYPPNAHAGAGTSVPA